MYEVTEQVLQATLNYLATRPFNEVTELIAVLRQSKKIEPVEPKEDAKDKK